MLGDEWLNDFDQDHEEQLHDEALADDLHASVMKSDVNIVQYEQGRGQLFTICGACQNLAQT